MSKNVNKNILLSLFALLFVGLACSVEKVPTITPTIEAENTITSTIYPTIIPTITISPSETITPSKNQLIITVNNLNIRKEANEYSEIIGYLQKGDIVDYIICENDWCELQSGGFVKQKYTEEKK